MEPLDLTNLPNYSGAAGAACPKCGLQDPTKPHNSTWVPGHTNIYPGGEMHWAEADRPNQPGIELRNCGRCSYGWPERTLDNPAA